MVEYNASSKEGPFQFGTVESRKHIFHISYTKFTEQFVRRLNMFKKLPLTPSPGSRSIIVLH